MVKQLKSNLKIGLKSKWA